MRSPISPLVLVSSVVVAKVATFTGVGMAVVVGFLLPSLLLPVVVLAAVVSLVDFSPRLSRRTSFLVPVRKLFNILVLAVSGLGLGTPSPAGLVP